MANGSVNLDKAVEIARGVYWVGYRNPKSIFQLNPYLRVYDGRINYLIDPGSPIDFAVISRKIGEVIGDISKIALYSLNHQDPDVSMNAAFLKTLAPNATCLCTEDTWRLVVHYDLNPQRVRFVEKFKNWEIKLTTGHMLRFIPTPFCHFKGAFGVYDVESRVLFTGDLFGGLNDPGVLDLYATEKNWEGIKAFHQLYMPTNKALKAAVKKIRALSPKPEIIAPQHGSIITGVLIDEFLERMYHLPVGEDLIEEEEEFLNLDKYFEVARILLNTSTEFIGIEKTMAKLTSNPGRDELRDLATFESKGIRSINKSGKRAVELMLMRLSEGESYQMTNQLKAMALKEAILRQLPPPTVSLEEGGVPIMAEAAGGTFVEE